MFISVDYSLLKEIKYCLYYILVIYSYGDQRKIPYTKEDDEDVFKDSKKARLEEQTIIDEGEDIALTKLTELAREASEDKWESKVDKYVNDGLTEEEARLNANRKFICL
jgi:hypothetical protein